MSGHRKNLHFTQHNDPFAHHFFEPLPDSRGANEWLRDHLAPIVKSRLIDAVGSVECRRKHPRVRTIAMPVGLVFARGDRAGDGKRIADEIRASISYWNADSAEDLHFLLCGWHWEDDELVYEQEAFLRFRNAIESTSAWRYSGETEILLVQYVVDMGKVYRSSEPMRWPYRYESTCSMDLSTAIVLPIEQMLREKSGAGTLDGLMSELCRAAREVEVDSGVPILWQISDAAGVKRIKSGLAQMILKKLGVDKIWDESKYFGVRDLRLNGGKV